MIRSLLSALIRGSVVLLAIAILAPALHGQTCDPNTQDCPVDPPPCLCQNGQQVWIWKYTVVISKAMDAERVTLSLIGAMPEPIPQPVAAALLGIADDFARIQGLVVSARSLSLRAAMPVPLPVPGAMPVPPPRVLAQQARQAREQAVRIAESIQTRAAAAGVQAALSPMAADLAAKVGELPVPLP